MNRRDLAKLTAPTLVTANARLEPVEISPQSAAIGFHIVDFRDADDTATVLLRNRHERRKLAKLKRARTIRTALVLESH